MNLFTRSVASITAALHTMVTRLEAHAVEKREEAQLHTEHANNYRTKATEALSEAHQADRVREKLTGILD